jgi:hypothetical protein
VPLAWTTSPFDHGPCGTDLRLVNGAGCFDVNDDAELHVGEIVVGVSKECRPLDSNLKQDVSDHRSMFYGLVRFGYLIQGEDAANGMHHLSLTAPLRYSLSSFFTQR